MILALGLLIKLEGAGKLSHSALQHLVQDHSKKLKLLLSLTLAGELERLNLNGLGLK